MHTNKTAIQLLAVASCLSLVIGLHAFAKPQIQQLDSLATASAGLSEAAVAQDQNVAPAGCTDSCCGGGKCCGNDCCNSCCEAACCPKRVTEEVA